MISSVRTAAQPLAALPLAAVPLAVLLLATLFLTSASPVLAQSLAQEAGNRTYPSPAGQSFTAPLDGLVSRIDVRSRTITPNAILRLYEGNVGSGISGDPGSPVRTQTSVTLLDATGNSSAFPMTRIDLDNPLPVVQGNSYSFVIEGGELAGRDSSPYPGGSRLKDYADIVIIDDLAFRIFIDPEPLCGATPVTGCRRGGKARMVIRTKGDPAVHKMKWVWSRGDATRGNDLGDPLTTTDYALCIYDGNTLVEELLIPPGGNCDGKPCWKRRGSASDPSGFRYKSKDAVVDGIRTIRLRTGGQDRAKMNWKGKGSNLPLFALPYSGDVDVQVQNRTTPICWSSLFTGSGIRRNTIDAFKGKDRR